MEDIALAGQFEKYALLLLRRLADDDGYRRRYESNPVQALREIGVPEDILGKLPPDHQKPIKLADKDVFRQALYQVIDKVASVCVCHSPPQIKLSIGSPQATSFGSS